MYGTSDKDLAPIDPNRIDGVSVEEADEIGYFDGLFVVRKTEKVNGITSIYLSLLLYNFDGFGVQSEPILSPGAQLELFGESRGGSSLSGS